MRNVDQLKQISDTWVRRRLWLVQQSKILETVDISDLIAAAAQFNLTVNRTVDANGKELIVIPEDKRELKNLLRFLDDDYYTSPVSKIIIEQTRKSAFRSVLLSSWNKGSGAIHSAQRRSSCHQLALCAVKATLQECSVMAGLIQQSKQTVPPRVPSASLAVKHIALLGTLRASTADRLPPVAWSRHGAVPRAQQPQPETGILLLAQRYPPIVRRAFLIGLER